MKEEGIIEKVTRPTKWCTAMVPVLKPNKREVRPLLCRPQEAELCSEIERVCIAHC